MIISVYRYLSIKGENTDEVKTKLVRATTYADILENKTFETDNNTKYCIVMLQMEKEFPEFV